MAWGVGIQVIWSDVCNVYITAVDPSDCIKVRDVNFRKGTKTMNTKVKSNHHSGVIEIRLDTPNGELISTLKVEKSKIGKKKAAK